MKRQFFLLFILITIHQNLNSQSKDSIPKKDAITQQGLLNSKTKLEIEKLRKEVKTIDYTPWLQAGTFIAALIAAAVSLITASRSQRIQSKSLDNQIDQQQKERISSLLKELGSDQLPIKLGSIHALSEYESSYPFLINLLRQETNHTVVSLVSKVLKRNTSLCIPLIVEETLILHHENLNIACSLIKQGIDRKEISAKLDLNNKELQDWFSSKYSNRNDSNESFDFGNIPKTELAKDAVILQLKKTWEKNKAGYNNLITVLEELIRIAVSNHEIHKIENGYITNLNLKNINLSKWCFVNCNLSHSYFYECELNDSIFSGIIAKDLTIRESKINGLRMTNSSLKQSDIKDSKGKNIIIEKCTFYETDFGGANMRYSKYIECKWSSCNLQGSILANSDYSNCIFHACNFSACFYQESKFTKGKIMQCDFKTAKVINTKFNEFAIYKSKVERSNFDDCSFNNSSLNTIEFLKTNMNRVSMSLCYLTKIVSDNETTFVGTKIDKNCVLKNCSDVIENLLT